MENVPGLLGMRGRHILTEFERMLHDAGYTYEIKRVDAADFGVPQSRRRVLFVGCRMGDPTPATDFATKPRTTVREAFADLPPAAAAGAKGALDPLHITSRMSALNVERLRHIPPGGGFEDLPVEMRVRAHKNGAAKIGHRAVYGRLHPDRPAGVITARFDSFTRGRFAHPIEDRNITLREGARLQSFPDDFAFLGNREEITALIGNAVPPKVAESVGAILRAHLGNAAPEGGVRPASLT